MRSIGWMGLGLALALCSGGCTAKLQQELKDRNATIEELNALVAELRRDTEAERARAQDLDGRNKKLLEEKAALEGKLAKKPEDDGLRGELPKETDLGWRHNMVSIGLPTTVTFASGKQELTDQGKGIIRKVAEVVARRFPDRWLYVAGHTDDQPIQKTRELYRSNRHLSLERADAVATFLVACKVPEKQIAVIGFGENDPKASNKDDKGRQENRRVEVLIGPPMGK